MRKHALVLEDYQKEFVRLIIENKRFGVFLRVGAGKTLIMLEALDQLFLREEVKKVLIFAPKHVIKNAWVDEIERWGYGFTYHVATGNGLKMIPDVQIYIATSDAPRSKFYYNFLVTVNPDCIIVDESSKYRNHTSRRTSAMLATCLKKVKVGKKIVGHAYLTERLYLLSATPAPNHVENLFTQGLLLDGGESLGLTLTSFRDSFCKRVGNFNKHEVRAGLENVIFDKIKHISRSCELLHFTTPRFIYTKLEPKHKQEFKERYKMLKSECLLELENESEQYIRFNLQAKMAKLRQISSGFLYETVEKSNSFGQSFEEKICHRFDSIKLDALEMLLDDLEDRTLLIAYNFTEECNMISKRLDKLKVSYDVISGQMSQKKVTNIIEKWNNKKLKVLMGHPAAMGHGLNLQQGGSDILWYSPTLDYELYVQMNGRLDRKGQKEQVIIRHFVVKSTLESDIYAKLKNKKGLLDALLDHIKAD